MGLFNKFGVVFWSKGLFIYTQFNNFLLNDPELIQKYGNDRDFNKRRYFGIKKTGDTFRKLKSNRFVDVGRQLHYNSVENHYVQDFEIEILKLIDSHGSIDKLTDFFYAEICDDLAEYKKSHLNIDESVLFKTDCGIYSANKLFFDRINNTRSINSILIGKEYGLICYYGINEFLGIALGFKID